jgi:hypothetical protein
MVGAICALSNRCVTWSEVAPCVEFQIMVRWMTGPKVF